MLVIGEKKYLLLSDYSKRVFDSPWGKKSGSKMADIRPATVVNLLLVFEC